MLQLFTKKHRGFTLVELLVVIAIIGILASIVLVSLGGARTRAQDARVISDLNQIRQIGEIIRVAEGNYATVWNNADVVTLTNDMTAQNATNIFRTSNAVGYCVETLLPGGKWACVNSGLVIRTDLATNPNCTSTGNANGNATNSITCP